MADVTWHDQERINAFSRATQQLAVLAGVLDARRADRDELQEALGELELCMDGDLISYQVGDSFARIPVAEARGRVQQAADAADRSIGECEGARAAVQASVAALKEELCKRFGDRIRLEPE